MRLHVLTGCHELLRPLVITPEEAGSLIGPRVRSATASWLSPERGRYYHTFLQDEPWDHRTKVAALALKDEFGARFEPLIVLPDLLDEIEPTGEHILPLVAADRRSQRTVLSEIWSCGHLRELRFYGLALPAKADPEGFWAVPAGIVTSAVRNRLEKLRSATIADIGSDAIETQVIEATPDLAIFNTLYNNSVGNLFALRLAPRLREQGLAPDVELLPDSIVRILADWNKKGVFPALPLRTDHLNAMTELIYDKLL